MPEHALIDSTTDYPKQAGNPRESQEALVRLRSLSHTHKVVIAGNHDMAFDVKDKAR